MNQNQGYNHQQGGLNNLLQLLNQFRQRYQNYEGYVEELKDQAENEFEDEAFEEEEHDNEGEYDDEEE